MSHLIRLIFTKRMLLLLILYSTSCISVKKVPFNQIVDTANKKIHFQKKKNFYFKDVGVHFTNQFEGSRLNNVVKINDSIFEVQILPENIPINSSPFYAFKVWGNQTKKIVIHFKYPKQFKHRYIPKIKSNNLWVVADSTRFSLSDSLSILKLSINPAPTLVSAQELHSNESVYSWINQLIVGKEAFVQLKNIGKTKLDRPIKVLDINKGKSKNKPIIVLLTRQHPPEVTGYFAFQAFLTEIFQQNELTDNFLEKYRILAFPLMNPDGVALGHWRHNANGVDLNRDWSKYRQPEIKNTVKYITKILKKNNSKLILGLDFHSTWYDVFYTNKDNELTEIPDFSTHWFEELESRIPKYEVNEKSSNSETPVSKGWFLFGHNAVGITFEIGDETPKDRIEIIGKEAAKAMMNILSKQ